MSVAWEWALPVLLLVAPLVWFHVRRRRPTRVVVPSLLPFDHPSVVARPPRPRRLADLSLLLQVLVVVCCALGLGRASCAGDERPTLDLVLDRSASLRERSAEVLFEVGRAAAAALPPGATLRIHALDRPEDAPLVRDVADDARPAVLDGDAPAADGLPGSLAPHLARGRPFVLVTDRDLEDLPGVVVWSVGTRPVDAALVGVFPGEDGELLLRVQVRGDPGALTVELGDRRVSPEVPPGHLFVETTVEPPTERRRVRLRIDGVVVDEAVLLPADEPLRYHATPSVTHAVTEVLELAGARRVSAPEQAELRVVQGGVLGEAPGRHVLHVAPTGGRVGTLSVTAAPEARVDGARVIGTHDAPALPIPTTRLRASGALTGADAVWRIRSETGDAWGVVGGSADRFVVCLEPAGDWLDDASFPALLHHALLETAPRRPEPVRLEVSAPLDERLPPLHSGRVPTGARLAELLREGEDPAASAVPFWLAAALLVALAGLERYRRR